MVYSIRTICALVLAVAVVAPLNVNAADPSRADSAKQATEAYERGMTHFQLDEYDAAIKEWEDGFRIRAAPQFLYNLAQAYRLSKRPEKALSFYRKFLNMDPKTPTRGTVERYIAALEVTVAEQKNAPPPHVDEPAPVPVTASPSQPPPPVAAAAVASAPSGTATGTPSGVAMPDSALVAHAPARKPLYKKGWFWGVLAGSIVVAGGAVALGVVLGTRTSVNPVLPSVNF